VLAETQSEEEAMRDDADEEDALENGDVHSNPVRVLDVLTESNDAEQPVVGTASLDRWQACLADNNP